MTGAKLHKQLDRCVFKAVPTIIQSENKFQIRQSQTCLQCALKG